jgi:hypothetical protein
MLDVSEVQLKSPPKTAMKAATLDSWKTKLWNVAVSKIWKKALIAHLTTTASSAETLTNATTRTTRVTGSLVGLAVVSPLARMLFQDSVSTIRRMIVV